MIVWGISPFLIVFADSQNNLTNSGVWRNGLGMGFGGEEFAGGMGFVWDLANSVGLGMGFLSLYWFEHHFCPLR